MNLLSSNSTDSKMLNRTFDESGELSEKGIDLVSVDVPNAGESTNSTNQQHSGQNRTLDSSIPARSFVALSFGGLSVVVVAGFGIEEPSETFGRRGGGRRRRAAERLLLLLRLFEGGRTWLEEMESSEGGGGEGEWERRGSES